MPIHLIAPGDAVAELAEIHGLFAETIWNHPRNAPLREKRQRYDALAPGDALFIPDRQERSAPIATGQRHRFLRKGIPAKFRLQLRAGGLPRAHLAFRLDVAGRVTTGKTDADGVVEAFVPASARTGTLRLGHDGPALRLHFASMEPDNTAGGMRKRLANEGIAAPADDDVTSPAWRLAIYRFQRRCGLSPTMELNEETSKALRERHDRVGTWEK